MRSNNEIYSFIFIVAVELSVAIHSTCLALDATFEELVLRNDNVGAVITQAHLSTYKSDSPSTHQDSPGPCQYYCSAAADSIPRDVMPYLIELGTKGYRHECTFKKHNADLEL